MDASSPANDPKTPRTRLAPSPTGALHLGNIRTFLVNAALARQNEWDVVMRIEDLDGPRIKTNAASQMLDTFEWLGLWWDEGPFVQSDDLEPYANALGQLSASALAYPCDLSRKEIEETMSAPHAPQPQSTQNNSQQESVFPRSLRPEITPRPFDNRETNWRFVVGEDAVTFHDRFAGDQRFNLAQSVGDFPIWTKRSVPAYQLSVVVDDAAQGITQVVRGDDLLDSAARQILLQRALGLPEIENYYHLPLVIGEDGRRLAKRHGDTRLQRYRDLGASAERVIGLIARWCDITDEWREMPIDEFCERFDLDTMSREPVVFRKEDEAWLALH